MQACREWVRSRLQERGAKPFDFARTVPPFNPTQSDSNSTFSECPRNPQTESLLQILGLPYLLDSAPEASELTQTPTLSVQRSSFIGNDEEIPIDDVDDLVELAEVDGMDTGNQ
uniref:Lariat debranching enzyme C-terminal domain-containing protein n=1 Tax=Rhizophora mucronata TaxID=61149 RepID=A0A2P2L3T8_RHIMU